MRRTQLEQIWPAKLHYADIDDVRGRFGEASLGRKTAGLAKEAQWARHLLIKSAGRLTSA